ncbi:MAG: 2-succinyl-5-enolpyruvyl-6-hydroxy-3-cyclohexene-1-carboxylic-acid synthase [Candidatus Nanopelagicales bacterium]|nr:2-succinyl-5-enolpyruvyl-6-hydroxy-3-cyclohexene-1-carboxylic-acid synthase [Candidatus Nanopelagicales bacterium]
MNASTVQARVFVDELIRCGITDFVLAPGSRSAPLAFVLAAAEQRGEIVLHVRLDERSAGYLALGLGKASGVPAVVVTTSGTAAINLHPAVVEADHSNIPLIALTADRPPSLRGVGANQSIAQTDIYGPSVRLAVDMAVAVDAGQEMRYWRSTVSRVVAAATDAWHPGPVHVNMPFADPLVPDAVDDDEPAAALGGRTDGRPWTADARFVAGMSTPLDDVMGVISDDTEVPARGIIFVGDHADPESMSLIDDLGDALGWPIIGEPSGNVSDCDTSLSHGALIVADADFASANAPDVVITVGRVGLSRAVLRMIANSPLHIAVDPQSQWSDPTRSANIVIAGVPLPPENAAVEPAWLETWQGADVLAAAAVETVLASCGDQLTGMQVARLTCSAVPAGGMLFLGASSQVRHVFNLASSSISEAVVMGNRGTSGIDGAISSAWGAALALQRGDEGDDPTWAVVLVGDQTFLYDTNALLVPAGEPRPNLVIVVADNDGGGIFSQLEQGEPRFAESFDRIFAVPLGADVGAIASAMQIPTQVVHTAADLEDALVSAISAGGVQVVVARTCSRVDEAVAWRSVGEAVHAALGSA